MLDRIPSRHGKRLNVVIETPRGSRNKLCYDHGMRLMRLGKQLPAGAVFPFDYGFVPSTMAADGDPLDVLVLLDSPTFPGCLVRARLLGVVGGRQTGRSGRTVDNPRLIAVATKSLTPWSPTARPSPVRRTVDGTGLRQAGGEQASASRGTPR